MIKKVPQLLKYIGNKTKYSEEICLNFQKDYDIYFEPFFGSGAVLGTLKPKATIQAKDSSKNIKEVDVTESEMFLKMVDSYLNSENLTIKELNEFYSNETNNPKFDKLQKELPKYYETIIEKFKSVKQSLQNKETN